MVSGEPCASGRDAQCEHSGFGAEYSGGCLFARSGSLDAAIDCDASRRSAKYGFQYVDWQFDGNDIIAAVRTGFVDDAGGPHNFHDANYLLFRRIADFRKLGTASLKGAPFASAEVASAEQMKKWTAITLTDAQRSPAGVGSEPMGSYEHHYHHTHDPREDRGRRSSIATGPMSSLWSMAAPHSLVEDIWSSPA